MADLFAGTYIKVELGVAGATASTTWDVIPEIALFPTSGAESTTIEVKTFNSVYNRVLMGSRKASELALSVNWIFDNPIHSKLLAAAESQTRVQLKITYYTDATLTTGYALVQNGYISKNGATGDKDSVVVQEMTFVPDGKAISNGVVTK